MGVTLIKFLESQGAQNRALYYLDNGESDLPKLYSDTGIDCGSIAICPKNGMQWILNSNKTWVRSAIDLEGVSHTIHNNGASGGYSTEELEVNIPHISNIDVFPVYIEAKPGNTVQFIANVHGSNLATEDVTWSITKTSALHQDTSISKDGLLTISPLQKKALLEIVATSNDDKTTFGKGTVQCYTTGAQPVASVTGIIISPKSVYQTKTKTVQFKAEVAGSQNFDKSISWEILGATDSTIDNNGVVTVGANEKSLAFIVKAYSSSNRQYNDAGTVIIAESAAKSNVERVEIRPLEVEIKKKGNYTFYATVSGSTEASKEIIWSISGQQSAKTFISPKGTLYVADDETSKQITIKAISCQNPQVFDERIYQVLSGEDDGKINITSVDFILTHERVPKGGSAQFVAIASGKNIGTGNIEYSVSNNSSEYTTISSSGILIVATEEKASSILINVVSTEDPSKQSSIVVVLDPVEKQSEEKTSMVPEVDLLPVNTFYLRGVDVEGHAMWKPATDVYGIEEAPTSDLNAEYIRKTIEHGKNVWVKANYLRDAPNTKPGTKYVRKTDKNGQNVWVEDPDGVEEAPTDGAGKQYVRQTQSDGSHIWVEAKTGGIEDAPTDIDGAQYIRKTVGGKNIWERFLGGDGIPTITKEEWNALSPEQRPPLAYIKENWLRPIKTYITDENGYLY